MPPEKKFKPGDYVEVVAPLGKIMCCSIDRDPYTNSLQQGWIEWFYVKSGSRGVVLGASMTKYSDTSDGYLPVQLESRRGWIREQRLRKLS